MNLSADTDGTELQLQYNPEYKTILPAELHILDASHREYPGFQLYACIVSSDTR